MGRALGVGLILGLFGVAPSDIMAQGLMVGAGVGMSSGPFRVFDWYEGSYGPDAILDVRLGRRVGGRYEVYSRLGFSAFGSLTVEACSDSCHPVTQYGGSVLTAGLGGGVRLTPRVTATLGAGLAKFVGAWAGEDPVLLLPSGDFHPRDLGEGPPTIGLEVALRVGLNDRWGLEIVDLTSLQAGPGSDGATHRVRLLLSWVASGKR